MSPKSKKREEKIIQATIEAGKLKGEAYAKAMVRVLQMSAAAREQKGTAITKTCVGKPHENSTYGVTRNGKAY